MIQKTLSRPDRRRNELRAFYATSVHAMPSGESLPVLYYDGQEIWTGRITDDRDEAFHRASRQMDEMVEAALELEETARRHDITDPFYAPGAKP